MIIAGAGGHSLEVLEVLLKNGFPKNEILFFDQDPKKNGQEIDGIKVVSSLVEVKHHFTISNDFCLGVGNPAARQNLCDLLELTGGSLKSIKDDSSFISHTANGQYDALPFSFIGPKTKIGKGVLINTRAHIHHECQVGDFSDIGPGAMMLGNSQIGEYCRIGAGAVILPGVKLGNEVTVGSGAVVTKDVVDNQTVIGIPAVPLRKKE
ncbi:NeuD/PglB/VioB family sugar acetyltransferase [Algoriphagus marinus]|uniref:NeuD/PglB/VioB family sugar acetyltransferase n=1 Tax=Algoriphagus marinus TaxID=1925762 RepID=UPI00094B9238|nr:NeuD/PglB/VioB family sugar acetyltransferase [Algoriphagus marinus]